MDVDEGVDIPEPAEPKFEWRYFDEDEEFEKLLEACNQKGKLIIINIMTLGIRERKL